MPSEKILATKQQYVAQVRERLENSVAGVIVDYKGISVANDTALRKSLREAGVEYTVIKNTMLRHAIKDTNLEGLGNVLEGTTALATSSDDLIAAAKLLNKYAKQSNGAFTIKAGYVEGKILDEAGVVALAKLPSREVLLSTVFGTLQAPIAAFARCIKQIAEKNGAPAEDAAAEAEAPAEA